MCTLAGKPSISAILSKTEGDQHVLTRSGPLEGEDVPSYVGLFF